MRDQQHPGTYGGCVALSAQAGLQELLEIVHQAGLLGVHAVQLLAVQQQNVITCIGLHKHSLLPPVPSPTA
jgi:hypothetical protein